MKKIHEFIQKLWWNNFFTEIVLHLLMIWDLSILFLAQKSYLTNLTSSVKKDQILEFSLPVRGFVTYSLLYFFSSSQIICYLSSVVFILFQSDNLSPILFCISSLPTRWFVTYSVLYFSSSRPRICHIFSIVFLLLHSEDLTLILCCISSRPVRGFDTYSLMCFFSSSQIIFTYSLLLSSFFSQRIIYRSKILYTLFTTETFDPLNDNW